MPARDPFDDEDDFDHELAAHRLVCSTAILCAHAEVGCAEALAECEAAYEAANDARERLEVAIDVLNQWAARGEQACILHARAMDRAG